MAGDDDPAGDQATVRAKVPLFRGTTKDTLTTMAWCEAVDRQMKQLGWSEAKTCVCAVDSFREEAAEWYRVVQEEQPEAIQEWKTFRPLIVRRFGVSRSPAQRVAMISNLAQKSGEGTETFYDRVAGAYYEVLRETLGALTDPHKKERCEGFRSARDELLKLTFVAGLRQNIREGVEARMDGNSTLAWIREAAAALEVATSRKKTAYAAVATSGATPIPSAGHADAATYGMSDLQRLIRAELAAMRPAQAPIPAPRLSQVAAGQYQPAEPGKQKTPRVTEATKRLGPMSDRGWLYCNRCCQWGLHIRPECYWSNDAIMRLPKQSPSEKPTGTPSDRQYPKA